MTKLNVAVITLHLEVSNLLELFILSAFYKPGQPQVKQPLAAALAFSPITISRRNVAIGLASPKGMFSLGYSADTGARFVSIDLRQGKVFRLGGWKRNRAALGSGRD